MGAFFYGLFSPSYMTAASLSSPLHPGTRDINRAPAINCKLENPSTFSSSFSLGHFNFVTQKTSQYRDYISNSLLTCKNCKCLSVVQ